MKLRGFANDIEEYNIGIQLANEFGEPPEKHGEFIRRMMRKYKRARSSINMWELTIKLKRTGVNHIR